MAALLSRVILASILLLISGLTGWGPPLRPTAQVSQPDQASLAAGRVTVGVVDMTVVGAREVVISM